MKFKLLLIVLSLVFCSCSKKNVNIEYPNLSCNYCDQNNTVLKRVTEDFYIKSNKNKVQLLDKSQEEITDGKVGEVVFNLIKEKQLVFREIDLYVDKSIRMKLVDSIIKEFRRAGIIKVNYHINNDDFLFKRFISYSCPDRYNLPIEYRSGLKEVSYNDYQKRYYNYEYVYIEQDKPYELGVFGFEEECSDNGVISCGPPPEKDYVKVFFQGKNQLILNNMSLTNKSLLDSIDSFAKNNKLLVHEYSENLTYKDFLLYKVYYVNQIQKHRDSLSINQYNSDYKSLSKEKRNEVKKTYPLQFFSYKNQNMYKDIFIPDSVLMKEFSKQKKLIN